MAMEITDKMVGIFVAAILTAALIPVAIQLVITGGASLINISGSGTNADPAVITLFGIISIAVIVAIVIMFFKII